MVKETSRTAWRWRARPSAAEILKVTARSSTSRTGGVFIGLLGRVGHGGGIETGWRPQARSAADARTGSHRWHRSEEHTSEIQSLMRISYAVFRLKQKKI